MKAKSHNSLDINAGDVFDELTVICEVEKNSAGLRRFCCKCSCGNIKTITLHNLKNNAKSCGHLKKIPHNKQNLIGMTFGNLKVIDYDYTRNSNQLGPRKTFYICKCSCGSIVCKQSISVNAGSLTSNHTKSCRRGYINGAIHTYKQIFLHRYNDGDLTFEQFVELASQNCYLCGTRPANKANHLKNEANQAGRHSLELKERPRYQEYLESGTIIYNGLDRVDSSEPHDFDNVRPCCKQCNWAKSDNTLEEFDDWIKRVAKNRFNVII